VVRSRAALAEIAANGSGAGRMDDKPSRVLVVEDDEAISTVLALTLVDEGYSVRQVGDAAEALETLRVWRPDVILLDVELPGPDGWAFRREQRALPGAADVPVVVVSAGHRMVAPSPELTPAVVLAKPFDLDVLLGTVDRLAARRGTRTAA
jgi:two-component system, OmpR family, response regulator